jgi:D-aminopeptidase
VDHDVASLGPWPQTDDDTDAGAGTVADAGATAAVRALRSIATPTWRFEPGPNNAITDVPGVRVGHCTVKDAGADACTGVTVVTARPDVTRRPLPAAVHVINGYGKSAGLMQIEELGELESPIALTGVFGVPSVLEALVEHLMDADPRIGAADSGRSVNAVVLECNDSRMNDPRRTRPGAVELRQAFADRREDVVAQGAVGAGSGMTTYGFAGGIGSASRRMATPAADHHIGALVLTNFGRREDLLVAGRPIGRLLTEEPSPPDPGGSVIVVLATDLPVGAQQLKRLARRAQNGLARVGCTTSSGSGEVVLAFSTSEGGSVSVGTLDTAFRAAAEAVEEAVLSSIFHAEPVVGRAGRQQEPFPVRRLPELMARASHALDARW